MTTFTEPTGFGVGTDSFGKLLFEYCVALILINDHLDVILYVPFKVQLEGQVFPLRFCTVKIKVSNPSPL